MLCPWRATGVQNASFCGICHQPTALHPPSTALPHSPPRPTPPTAYGPSKSKSESSLPQNPPPPRPPPSFTALHPPQPSPTALHPPAQPSLAAHIPPPQQQQPSTALQCLWWNGPPWGRTGNPAVGAARGKVSPGTPSSTPWPLTSFVPTHRPLHPKSKSPPVLPHGPAQPSTTTLQSLHPTACPPLHISHIRCGAQLPPNFTVTAIAECEALVPPARWEGCQGADAALANRGTTVPLSPIQNAFPSGLGQLISTISFQFFLH